MDLQQFDLKYMPALVERVIDLWSDKRESLSFRKTYVEAIIRQNMHGTDQRFMLTENNELKSITFVSTKDQHDSRNEWWEEQYAGLSDEHKKAFNVSHDYLTMMDRKAWAYMKSNDIKLNLFISMEKGWGKQLLDKTMEYYKSRGYQTMFLWTDCECNVEWYTSHGYILVEEDIYQNWSTEKNKYMTYIFKKPL